MSHIYLLQFFEGFYYWQNFEPTLTKYFATGHIFIAANGQNLITILLIFAD